LFHIGNDFFPAHSNAGIADGEGPGLFIGIEADLETAIIS